MSLCAVICKVNKYFSLFARHILTKVRVLFAHVRRGMTQLCHVENVLTEVSALTTAPPKPL